MEAPMDGGESACTPSVPGRGVVFPVALMAFALIVACGGGDDTAAGDAPTPPQQTMLVFTNGAGGEVELEVEVADEFEEQTLGLMFRHNLPQNSGMIFIFGFDHSTGFIMKDTLIPLSIAFTLADGTILDIQDMEPMEIGSHRPEQMYRHAIEVNQGWFERNGIAVGDHVDIPESITGS
jgi:uncharacterized membrane protein (UPF0127 family)